MTVEAVGQEGFVWFMGIVEDRNDPEKLGRVRVRAFNLHSSNTQRIRTEDLPWATVMMPPISPSINKTGISPTGLIVGSTVIGFYVDGNDCNLPVVLGTFYGKPNNSEALHEVQELARGINSVKKTNDGPEPSSAFGARYPYNKVMQTESGHVVEFDDTPNNERIHVFHKSGTYTEINNEGRQVDKVVGDHYEIVLKDKTVYIKGNVNISVDGSYTLNATGDVIINGATINLNKGTNGAARINDSTTDNDTETNGPDTGTITSGSGTVFIGD